MSKRIHKCSRQSLCPCWPLLVHADEGGESQDQVSAGQRDVRISCAPIGCSVGCCGQETREALISCDYNFFLCQTYDLQTRSRLGMVLTVETAITVPLPLISDGFSVALKLHSAGVTACPGQWWTLIVQNIQTVHHSGSSAFNMYLSQSTDAVRDTDMDIILNC